MDGIHRMEGTGGVSKSVPSLVRVCPLINSTDCFTLSVHSTEIRLSRYNRDFLSCFF